MDRLLGHIGFEPGGSDAKHLYLNLTVAAGVFCVVLELGYFYFFLQGHAPAFELPSVDGYGYAIGRDFLNTWMGGRAAFSGGPAAWFDLATYNAELQRIVGDRQIVNHFWSYPPHLLLFIWPFGLLPYLPAYVLWCAAGLALYLLAAWCGGLSRRDLPLVALAPGVFVNVFFGQNGFVTAALLIGGLTNIDRRPIRSGLLFGVLTVKPQFGLLLPVLLAMTGRWRVIAAATVTAVTLAGLTSLWFGADVWLEYVRKVMPQQHWLLTDGSGTLLLMVSSAFVNARVVGLSLEAAWLVQAVSSCCALAMVIWTFRHKRDPDLSFALFVTATFLFSPWMLNYDMALFGWIVVLLRERTDNTAVDHLLALAVWVLPLAMLVFGVARIPIAMLVLPTFAGRLMWRLARPEVSPIIAGEVRLHRSPA